MFYGFIVAFLSQVEVAQVGRHQME